MRFICQFTMANVISTIKSIDWQPTLLYSNNFPYEMSEGSMVNLLFSTIETAVNYFSNLMNT